MILGVMQPYFFPYLGYFELIAICDTWVVLDNVQYKQQSWMNRNRVLDGTGGWKYITVPVEKASAFTSIDRIHIHDKTRARDHMIGQLRHYRGFKAPFVRVVEGLVDRVFADTSSDLLRDLNVASLEAVCRYLGLHFDPMLMSRTDLSLPEIRSPGDWSLEIATALGADTYVNAPNGRGLFDADEFARRGIRLLFTELIDFRYATGGVPFVEHLSIIDVLMWNSPEVVAQELYRRAQRVASANAETTRSI